MNKNSINLKEGENAVKTAKKGSSLNNYLMTAVLGASTFLSGSGNAAETGKDVIRNDMSTQVSKILYKIEEGPKLAPVLDGEQSSDGLQNGSNTPSSTPSDKLKDEPVDEKKLAQEKELDNLVEKFEELAREAVVQLEKEVADIKDDAFNLPTNEELARALAQQQLDAREVSTDQETFEGKRVQVDRFPGPIGQLFRGLLGLPIVNFADAENVKSVPAYIEIVRNLNRQQIKNFAENPNEFLRYLSKMGYEYKQRRPVAPNGPRAQELLGKERSILIGEIQILDRNLDKLNNSNDDLYKLLVMKWVHDFAKRDGKIKDYDRSPWFIQEFDFYEELKGLGIEAYVDETGNFNEKGIEKLAVMVKRFENLLKNIGLEPKKFWIDARNNVEKVQSDFKERLTIQALQSDIGGINFMDAYEDEGLANANRLKKQAEIGGYIVENYGKVIEAKAEKAVYDYEKEFWQNQPEEFNSDGIRTHIFQRNDRDMLKQHVRESLTSTAISIFVAPPVVIPWVENSGASYNMIKIKDSKYGVLKGVDFEDALDSVDIKVRQEGDVIGTQIDKVQYSFGRGQSRVSTRKAFGFIPFAKIAIPMNRAGVDSSKIVPITMNGRGSNLDITLSPISVGIGASIYGNRETLKRGMDKMSLAYSRNLDITLTEIMAGKSFEQSVFVGRGNEKDTITKGVYDEMNAGYSKYKQKIDGAVDEFDKQLNDLLNNEHNYEVLKSLYEANGGHGVANAEALKAVALLNYRASLWKNASGKGVELSGFNFGALFSPFGFAPYLGFEFEKNSIKFYAAHQHAKNEGFVENDGFNIHQAKEGYDVVDTARDIVRNQIHELKGLNNKVIIEVADQQIRGNRAVTPCKCEVDYDVENLYKPGSVVIHYPRLHTHRGSITVAVGIGYGSGSGGGNGDGSGGGAGSNPGAGPGGVDVGGGVGGPGL